MTASTQHPHVLMTNDDGIEARGLHMLADTLQPEADVSVVAPCTERSATGHGISLLKDLQLETFHRNGTFWGWKLDGTPADCVKVAVLMLSKDRPYDLVISGINPGVNAGLNILYSGTVAAAREAALLGVPAMAVSLYYTDPNNQPFETAARVALDAYRIVRRRGLPRGIILNINVPPVAYEALRGWRVTRMGDSFYSDLFVHQPGQEEIATGTYRNVGDRWRPSQGEGEDLDDRVLNEGYVSVTPMQFDLTAHAFLPHLHAWFNEE